MWNNRRNCDAVVKCNGQTWQVSAGVLEAQSDYFAVVFRSGLAVSTPTKKVICLTLSEEATTKELTIDDEKPEHIGAALKFLYDWSEISPWLIIVSC